MDLLTRIAGRTDVVANLALAAGLAGVLGIESALTHNGPGNRSVGLLAGVAVGGLALFRKRNREWALIGGLTICSAAALAAVLVPWPSEPGVTATAGLLVLGASYLRTAPARRAGLAAAAGFVLLTVSRIGMRGSLILPAALLGVIAWGAALVLGVWWRSLDTHRRAGLDTARRDERLELARELHDAVAHHIAAIVLQSQAAHLLAVKRPELLPTALTEIESAGSEALTAMRRVIGLLRDTDDPPAAAPGAGQLAGLVNRFSAGGRAVEVRLPDDQEAWSPQVRTTVYRVTQEALTNIVRHAPEAHLVRIAVTEDPAGVNIDITDDGPRPRPPRPWTSTGGYGLVGMRERVEALGGHFQAGPGPERGWSVRASIPPDGGTS